MAVYNRVIINVNSTQALDQVILAGHETQKVAKVMLKLNSNLNSSNFR